MNALHFLIVLGIVLDGTLTQTPDDSGSSKIQSFFYERCRRKSTNAADYDNIDRQLKDLSDYVNYAASLLPQGKKAFCEDAVGNIAAQVGQLARALKPCFPDEERFLPNFFKRSVGSFLEFLCESGGKNIDNFFSSQGAECRQGLKSEQAGEEVSTCFKSVFKPSDGIIKQAHMCQDLRAGRDCFDNALSRHCKDFRAYGDLNRRFFDAVSKPCNAGVVFGVSNFVLGAVALITLKFIS